jgi:undecaprenyl-diphosphatase
LIYLISVILGLVEGLTEFIPVSSTGHLILAGHLLGFEGARASTFEIFIQFGAILAVVWLYKERFWRLLDFRKSSGLAGWRGLGLLALTSFPALALGFVGHSFIKERLFNPFTVAVGLSLGGLAILLVERRRLPASVAGLDEIGWRAALFIGLFQCLALWPGVSRAAATILGGMLLGLERKTAAEYSFLIAVPPIFAAASYDLYKNLPILQPSDALVFAIGFGVAFFSAIVAIRFFLRLLAWRDMSPFGWYRLALAALVLIFLTGARSL